MLQRLPSSPYNEPPERSTVDGGLLSIADIKRFLIRYWNTIASCIGISFLVSVIYILVATPIFTAQASLLIETGVPQTFRAQSPEQLVSLDTPQVESQIAIVRSEKIAERVVNQLGLADEKKNSDAGTAVSSEADRRRSAIERLQSEMDVRRLGLSYAINISYDAADPKTAAQRANAIAQAYVEDQIENRSQSARQGSKWLEERIDDLRKQMNSAALDVQQFRAKRDYRIVGRADKPNAAEQTDRQPGGRESPLRIDEQTTLEELETRAETYRKIFESYLQAYAESVQRQSYPVGSARIISPATPPKMKSRPRTVLTLAIGGLVGGLAGLGIALLLNSLDFRLRSARQVREELGVECLGLVTAHDAPRPFDILVRPKLRWLGLGNSPLLAERDYKLSEVVDLPFSKFSRSVKNTKRMLDMAMKSKSLRTLGVTSTLPKEGKTTLVSNLAALYATAGSRVLVVDADIYNSTLTRLLAPQCKNGLVELLLGKAELAECIVPLGVNRPALLPSGSGKQTSDIFDQKRLEPMRTLIGKLKADYDVILFDLPPMKPVTDALMLCPLLDAALLAVQWGETTVPLAADALYELQRVQTQLLGVVLTMSEEKADERYGLGARASDYV